MGQASICLLIALPTRDRAGIREQALGSSVAWAPSMICAASSSACSGNGACSIAGADVGEVDLPLIGVPAAGLLLVTYLPMISLALVDLFCR
jgi:hypothetical protein